MRHHTLMKDFGESEFKPLHIVVLSLVGSIPGWYYAGYAMEQDNGWVPYQNSDFFSYPSLDKAVAVAQGMADREFGIKLD